MSRHVFLVAAEDSGDALGADVADALKAADSGLWISVIGGERLRERGANCDVDLSGLAILGLFDGIRVLARVKRAVMAAANAIQKADPDVVVLIDSWGFMFRLAKELKNRGVRARRIKLIGPQVWASRPGRARVLASVCDHLLCIHAFEQAYYERWGLPTTVIGNPALGRREQGDGGAFRKAHGLARDTVAIGLLPGSRQSEIKRVSPALEEACAQLCANRSDRVVVCVLATSIENDMRRRASQWTFPHVIVSGETAKADAFAAMDLALACSGTVTTEVAAQGAPLLVGYRLGWITWVVARLGLMRSRYITLLNVAAGREIAPEFIQTRLTASNVAAAAESLLSNPEALQRQRTEQAGALSKMAGPGRPAGQIAAETILGLM